MCYYTYGGILCKNKAHPIDINGTLVSRKGPGNSVLISPESGIVKPVEMRYKKVGIASESKPKGLVLQPWQDEIAEEISSKFLSHMRGNHLLCVPTGGGKTYISLGILVKMLEVHGLRALVVVNNRINGQSWTNVARDYGINLDVFTIQFLVKQGYPYFQKYDIIFLDEVHNYPTEEWREIFWLTAVRWRVGITATPDSRLDGLDKYYYYHLGFPVWRDAGQSLVKMGSVCIMKYKATKFNYGKSTYSQFLDAIAADSERNKLIMFCLEKVLPKGNTFIFIERRNHAEEIYGTVVSKYGTQGIYLLMGGENIDLVKIAGDARVIVATYSFCKDGVSIPRMTCAILGTPRKTKFVQILGRIFRNGYANGEYRYIVDIWDSNSLAKKSITDRKDIYKSMNFLIKEMS